MTTYNHDLAGILRPYRTIVIKTRNLIKRLKRR